MVMGATEKYARHMEALKNAMDVIAESPLAGYVRELYLYGSFSRGDYSWGSDIDLLLSLEDECRYRFRRDILLLKGNVSKTDADAVDVDLKIVFGDDWKKSDMLYYQNIRREGKKLW